MRKFSIIIVTIVLILMPAIGICGALTPCTVVATANANTLVQAPDYYQSLGFANNPVFTYCTGANAPTTATIIIANPPQNPPPTAPVYLALNGAVAGTPQVLISQGTTVITINQFSGWFPSGTSTPSFTGVTVYSPATPWVPNSITIIWQ
jgi:hypothetical protein